MQQKKKGEKKENDQVVITTTPSVFSDEGEDVFADKAISGGEYARRKIFIQELRARVTKFRMELNQIVGPDERNKKIEEYRAETAKRIEEFLASEKESGNQKFPASS